MSNPCLGCPLDPAASFLRHPKMSPNISAHALDNTGPRILLLGEGPGSDEDEQGQQFIGASGQILRSFIPKEFDDFLIWDNVVRCRPTEKGERGGLRNRTPTQQEIEHCSKHSDNFIARLKPEYILLLGGTALDYIWRRGAPSASSQRISDIRGVWFGTDLGYSDNLIPCFATFHPSNMVRGGKDSLEGIVLRSDLAKFFADIKHHRVPVFDAPKPDKSNIELFRPNSPEELNNKLHAKLDHCLMPGLDFETNSTLTPFITGARVITAALSDGQDNTLAIDLPYNNIAQYIDVIAQFLSEREWSVQNAAFELLWLLYYCPQYRNKLIKNFTDSLLIVRALHNRVSGLDLGSMTRMFLGQDIKGMSPVDAEHIMDYPLHEILLYNGLDAKSMPPLINLLSEHLSTCSENQINEIAALHATIPLTVEMELRGLVINDQAASSVSAKIQQEVIKHQQEASALPEVQAFESAFGVKLLLSQNAQIAKCLQVQYNAELPKSKNGYTTDEAILSKLVEIPLARTVLNYRHVSKLESTYLKPIMAGGKVRHGNLIHPHYNTVVGTRTGRFSSNKPNIQNFPKRRDPYLREAIAPDPGTIFLAFDYAALEACGIAMYHQDPRLISEIINKIDTHRKWALEVLKIVPEHANFCLVESGMEIVTDLESWEQLSPKQFKAVRSFDKTNFVFATFYGSTNDNCARRMNIEESILLPIWEQFWIDYAVAKSSLDNLIQTYKETGEVQCLTYRKFSGPLKDDDIGNYPIQGGAADIVRDACIRLYNLSIELDEPQLMPRIHVHDELVFCVKENDIDLIRPVIEEEMVKAVWPFMCVPLTVEGSVGPDWFNMKSIGNFTGEVFHE